MSLLTPYLTSLRDLRTTGAAVAETSYYPALATLLDSVLGCAVHSTIPVGRGYTTLELKVNYIRAITAASGLITGTGEVVHAGRQVAVAEARAVDAAGHLCATASTTCLTFDRP